MPDPSEFYVGYLPAPRGAVRLVRLLAPAMIGAAAAAGILLARTQPDPGPAVWEDASREFTGVLAGGAYPVLFAEDGRPMLIVSSGKHGASERLAPLAGRRVALSGTLLKRGEGRMIELADEDAARDLGPGVPPPVRARGHAVLRGEIVDSKCYLGAMKPGHGRPHKECATLCIKGGIPPTLLFRGPDGEGACLVLNAAGGPMDPAAEALIADPVAITGELEEQGGLLRIRASEILPL